MCWGVSLHWTYGVSALFSSLFSRSTMDYHRVSPSDSVIGAKSGCTSIRPQLFEQHPRSKLIGRQTNAFQNQGPTYETDS